MARTLRAPWLAVALVALLASPAVASHTVFSSSADRFEVDGNAFGPFDGTPDQVDEFDDGNLAPNWAVLVGSATESGGLVTLHNPGLDINFFPGVTLDASNVENTTDVANGGGNFTATSWWLPTLPAVNRQLHFQLYGIGAAVEAAGLTVNNFDAAAASAEGAFTGYSITQEVVFVLGSGGVPQSDSVPINAADVTGPIVLRLAFDDATDTLTCSFSLDGGLTFQSPFPPLHVFQVVDESEILLGANSVTPNGPPPPPGCTGSFIRPRLDLRHLLAPPGDERLGFKDHLILPADVRAGFTPLADGLALVIADVPSPYAFTAPPGGVGTGCDPRDGWRVKGSKYIYRNYSDALPPGCAPRSAGGLRAFRFSRRRTSGSDATVRIMTGDSTIYDDPDRLVRATLLFGPDGSPLDCAEIQLYCQSMENGSLTRCR